MPSAAATMPRLRAKPRFAIVPPEVHAARAYARLAGLDLDELGIGGRPTCQQPAPLPAPKRPHLFARVGRRVVRAARAVGERLSRFAQMFLRPLF